MGERRTVLYLDFIDEEGKRKSLSVDQPKEDLSSTEIAEFMDFVIDSSMFEALYYKKAGARYVTRSVEKVEFE